MMNRTFLYTSLSLLIIVAVLFFMKNSKEIPQDQAYVFLTEINTSHRYVTTDQVAKRIIDNDPSIRLVDVRSTDEFNEYSIPGSINIPFESILNEEWSIELNQEALDIIFLSVDDFYSEQAWALCKRRGYTNLYVLDGGLNKWFSTIMLPQKPTEQASTDDFELYTFRTGASIFFGSGVVEVPKVVEVEVEVKEEPKPIEKKTIPVKKKVKAEAEGGC